MTHILVDKHEKFNNEKEADSDDFFIRTHKLNQLKKAGYNPYPERFEKKHSTSDIYLYAKSTKIPEADKLHKDDQTFTLAGRLMTFREHGKLTFAHLQDFEGKLQIAFSQNYLGQEKYELLHNFDLGDFLGVSGKVFVTHKGEITLMVDEFIFLGKSFRSLPEKFHGLKDMESTYRQRYLDLLVNTNTQERFKIRNKINTFLRNYLTQDNFIEVETPILASTASGALAKPFITHHNALDADFYLRIAPETYLKRLIVGGYEKVFEFAKCFRNEGIDPSHLQEFTMLEYYVAYWNWEDNLKYTEQLISQLVMDIFGTYDVTIFNKKISFKPPFARITMRDIIFEYCQIDIQKYNKVNELKQDIFKQKIEIENIENLGLGNLIDSLYKKIAREKIIQPTFLIAHPISLSPLARSNDENPELADRFQLLVNGWEIVNAYSELVDPREQKKRLQEQANLKETGDDEAMMMDDDYIKAMEYGMPPISGWGMGIDRITSLLTNSENLKDTIFFPLLKSKEVFHHVDFIKKEYELIKDPGITYEKAKEVLITYIPKIDALYKHSLAVEAIMRKLAKELKQPEEVWAIAGLLHDLDYPETKNNPLQHGLISEKILSKIGVHPEIIYAVKAHNYIHELSLNTLLAKALYSVEELAGLITACALVQPNKTLKEVTVDNIQKKFKQKAFASGVNRSIIQKAEEYLALPLERVILLSLEAMREISSDLEL